MHFAELSENSMRLWDSCEKALTTVLVKFELSRFYLSKSVDVTITRVKYKLISCIDHKVFRRPLSSQWVGDLITININATIMDLHFFGIKYFLKLLTSIYAILDRQ